MILLLMYFTLVQFTHQDRDSILFLNDEEVVEIFIQQQTDNENVNLDEVISKIEYYKSNKINIKKATAEQLKILPGMNDEILNLIIGFQKTRFLTKNQFLKSEVNEKINLQLVSQFLIYDEEVETLKLVLKNRVVSKSTYSEQNEADKYKGEIFTNYNFISLRSENISFNAVYKRDAGELFKYGSASYFLQANSIYFVDKLIIGNYSVNFGQGILISTKPNYYLSTMSFSEIFNENEILRGSSSSNELYSLKGGAIEIGMGSLKSILFLSKNYLAATIDSLNNIKSIYSENLFRTENEINKFNHLNEKISGVLLIYSLNENFNFGYGYRKSEFSKVVPLKYLTEQNKTLNLNSILANYESQNLKIKIDLSGEVNIAENNIYSLQINPIKRLSFILNKREYNSLYKINYVNAISNQSNLVLKEDGLLYGIIFNSLDGISINGFVDYYNITETNYTKSGGSETGIRIYKSKNKFNYFEFTKKYNNYISERENENIIIKNISTSKLKNKYRIQLHDIYNTINLLNRFEFLEVYEEKSYEKGILFSSTINYKLNNKFKVIGNITFYKTDSFKSRMWEFESNGRGYLAFAPLYSSGIKKILSADFELFKNFNLSIRYSQNTFDKNELFYSSQFKNSNEVILQIDYFSI